MDDEIIEFWIETVADNIRYPGLCKTINLPNSKETGIKRTLVLRIPQDLLDRKDIEIILLLGNKSLLITGKHDEDDLIDETE